MKKPAISTAHMIADEAIDQLDAAVQTIIQLEALFRAVRTNLDEHTDAARLVSIGEYAAMDQGNGFHCQREQLRERLEKVAPRSAQLENVARESEVQP